MMIITMAGHPDFVSKTSNDLVSRGLRNIHRIHREGCSICELEQLINCEKQSVTQRKRIENTGIDCGFIQNDRLLDGRLLLAHHL